MEVAGRLKRCDWFEMRVTRQYSNVYLKNHKTLQKEDLFKDQILYDLMFDF